MHTWMFTVHTTVKYKQSQLRHELNSPTTTSCPATPSATVVTRIVSHLRQSRAAQKSLILCGNFTTTTVWAWMRGGFIVAFAVLFVYPYVARRWWVDRLQSREISNLRGSPPLDYLALTSPHPSDLLRSLGLGHASSVSDVCMTKWWRDVTRTGGADARQKGVEYPATTARRGDDRVSTFLWTDFGVKLHV